jgi:hypothetical protein
MGSGIFYPPETPKFKAAHSMRDTRGHLFIDCSECERGGNGDAKDKCSCGWKVKKGKQGGCFIGTLMSGLEVV